MCSREHSITATMAALVTAKVKTKEEAKAKATAKVKTTGSAGRDT